MSFPNTNEIMSSAMTANQRAMTLMSEYRDLCVALEAQIETMRPMATEVDRLRQELATMTADRDRWRQECQNTKESEAYKSRRRIELETQEKAILEEKAKLGLAAKVGV